jgi:hypothetical protein
MEIIRQELSPGDRYFYYGPFETEEQANEARLKLNGTISIYKLYPPEAVGRIEDLLDNLA